MITALDDDNILFERVEIVDNGAINSVFTTTFDVFIETLLNTVTVARGVVKLVTTVIFDVANMLFESVVMNALDEVIVLFESVVILANGAVNSVLIVIFDVLTDELLNVVTVAKGVIIWFATTFELDNVLFESVVINAFGTERLVPIIMFDVDRSLLDNVNIVANGAVKFDVILTFELSNVLFDKVFIVANGPVRLEVTITFELVNVLFDRVVMKLLTDVNVLIIAVPGTCKLACGTFVPIPR